MNLGVLLHLILMLAPLSLVAVGGGFTVLPEIHRQVVGVHGWVTDAEFAQLYALAQASPGPNMLVVTLLGGRAAGPAGALVALLGPSSALAYFVVHVWGCAVRAPWRLAVQRGLAPVAVGLVLASGVLLTGAANHTPLAYLVTGISVVLFLRTQVHPLPLMAIGAGLAIAGWL